jgi:dinuclear metal center YbgI/SA1388 family protein
MRVADVVAAIESIAPPSYAESWDKVGLLVGDRAREVRGPVLLTIDLTERVLAEAQAQRASMVVAYHPPIWDELRRVTADTPRQRIVLRAIESGIAVYSPHTALDAVPGGVADWLCEGVSGSTDLGRIAGDCRALTPHGHLSPTQQVKLVTFVPEPHVETIRNAVATAGAGQIGAYKVCSFTTRGVGTFLGGEGANPSVGKAGHLETVPELRLEMVCSRQNLAIAIETLRRFHPYEEPAIDVYALEPHPLRTIGPGRRLVLDRPTTIHDMAQRLKSWIKRDRVRVALADPAHATTPLTRVGVCPGSGSSLARVARDQGCDVYVTGEMGHHDILASLHAGLSVIVAGHTSTERGYLPRLADQLRTRLTSPDAAGNPVDVRVSQEDADPLVLV